MESRENIAQVDPTELARKEMWKRCRASPWIHAGSVDLCSTNGKVFPKFCCFRWSSRNLIKNVAKFQPSGTRHSNTNPLPENTYRFFLEIVFFLVPVRLAVLRLVDSNAEVHHPLRAVYSLASSKLARFVSFHHSTLLSNHWLTSSPTSDVMRANALSKASPA